VRWTPLLNADLLLLLWAWARFHCIRGRDGRDDDRTVLGVSYQCSGLTMARTHSWANNGAACARDRERQVAVCWQTTNVAGNVDSVLAGTDAGDV